MNNAITYENIKLSPGSEKHRLMETTDLGGKLFFETGLLENKLSEENWQQPYKLCNYRVVWVTAGTGKFVVDLQEHMLEKDMMFMLTPGQISFFRPDESVEGYCISFSEEFFLMTGGSLNFPFGIAQQGKGDGLPLIRIDEEMKIEMGELVQKMIKETSNHFRLRSEILMGLLKVFIIYFSRKIVTKDGQKAQHHDLLLLKRFKHLLEEHFFTKKAVADYASELAVSPNYLSGKIKTISGFSASHHIQQRIVLEAKRKVMFSGGSMKEVAYYLGFDDTSHFSKFFKNKSGVNFTDFKKAMC